MIVLPTIGSYEPNKLSIPVNKDNMRVHAALNKGTKLFPLHSFECRLEPDHEHTPHIRMSQIGDCARKQWLNVFEHEKMEELKVETAHPNSNLGALNLGNVLEEYIIHLLNLGGMTVTDEQRGVVDLDGLITGHIDGILHTNVSRFLLELKALNMNSVSKIVYKGLKEGNEVYYAQMQYYMFKLHLEAGYFIALIKDSGQFYIEFIEEDREYQQGLRDKAQAIGDALLVERIPEKYIKRECMFCPAQTICADLDGGEDRFISLYKEYHGVHKVEK